MQRSEEHQGFEAQQPQQPQSSQSDEFQLSPEAIAAIKEYDQKIAKTPSLYEKKRVIYDSQISTSDPTYIGLSIDGGGIRGLLPAIMLQHLEDDHLGKTTNLWRAFDYIGGTSVGGIIALGIANDIRASDLVKLLEDRAEEVFSKRWVSYIPGSSLFTYPYDPQSLENVLKETFKETELHEAKTPVLVTSCTAQGLPFLFESKGPTQDYRMWEAARCTSAAPTYFKGFELPITKCRKTDQISRYVGDGTRPSNSNWSGPTYSWRVDHQLNSVVRDDGGSPAHSRQSPSVECTNHGSVTLVDGGLWVNNPSMLVLGSILRDHQPNFRQTYLLSLGTGQADPSSRPIMPVGAGKLFAIKPTIESLMESKSLATDIAIESLFDAHTDANIKNASQDYKIMYKGFGSYSMPKRQLNYCRLNPILERPIELDDISQKNLDYLKQTAQDPTLLRDIERFYDDVIRLKLEKDSKRNAI